VRGAGLTPAQEMLLEKYKLLVTQIIHWDTHFWNKSKFFLAIQTAFLGLFGAAGSAAFKHPFFCKPMIELGLVAVAVFNLYLCLVWYKTNVRNLQYRKFKIAEFLAIERRLRTLTIFDEHATRRFLPPSDSSSGWEKDMPFAFGFAWVFVLWYYLQ
jgi:hypothetical protein